GELIAKDQITDLQSLDFSLQRNGETVQEGNSKDMIFDFDSSITFVSQYITLRKGDLIYTGTPAGVGPVQIGDKLEGFLEGKSMFTCQIKYDEENYAILIGSH